MRRTACLLMGLFLITAMIACSSGGKAPSTPTPHRVIVRSAVDGIWYVIEKEDLQKAVQEEIAKAGKQVTVEMGTYLFMPAKEPTTLYWCNSKEKQEILDDCIKIENVLIKLGY